MSPPSGACDGATEADRRLVADGGEVRDPSTDEATLAVGFREILDHIDTSIFVVDGEGELVHWNEAVARLTGATARTSLDTVVSSRSTACAPPMASRTRRSGPVALAGAA